MTGPKELNTELAIGESSRNRAHKPPLPEFFTDKKTAIEFMVKNTHQPMKAVVNRFSDRKLSQELSDAIGRVSDSHKTFMERFHSSLDNREGLRDELHKLNHLIDAHRSKMRRAQDKMDDLAVQNWKDQKKTAKFEEENAVLKKKIKSSEEEVFEIEKKARHEGILTRAKTMNDLYQKAFSAGYEKGQQDDQA